MKRTIFLLTALLILAFSFIQAQGFYLKPYVDDLGNKGGRLVVDSCYVVGTNSYYSNTFTLNGLLASGFDSSYNRSAGECISICYAVDTLHGQAGTNVADVTLILQGSFTGSDKWTTAATIFSTTGKTAPTYTTLVTTAAKYPYYRWKATGITTNTYSRVFIGLYAYRKWGG